MGWAGSAQGWFEECVSFPEKPRGHSSLGNAGSLSHHALIACDFSVTQNEGSLKKFHGLLSALSWLGIQALLKAPGWEPPL